MTPTGRPSSPPPWAVGSVATIAVVLATLAPPTRAADPAWYDPDAVAQASVLFGSAAAELGPRFEAAQANLTKLGTSLEHLEIASALRADPTELQRAQSLRREFMGRFLELRAHVNLVQEDYDQVFTTAMERILPAVGRPVECHPRPTGLASIGMRGSMGQTCVGQDKSGAIATALDADPELARAVREINSLAWPDPTRPTDPWAPTGGAAQWVDLGQVAKAFVPELLDRRREALDAALAPLEPGLEAKDAGDIERAEALKQEYLQALGQDGAKLLPALAAALDRTQGAGTVGLCTLPAELGGCTGQDRTDSVLAALKTDKKWLKATASATR